MGKLYLDLETILQSFHQNGDLYANIPAKKLGNKVPWKVHLRLVEGIVVSCQILDNLDVVVNSGEPALKALYPLGQLYWDVTFDPPQGSSTLMNAKLSKSSAPLPGLPKQISPAPEPTAVHLLVPYRLIDITVQQMNQTRWPRDYRLVYILIDGKRTIEKIASMLSMSLSDVELILRELQSTRIIDLNP